MRLRTPLEFSLFLASVIAVLSGCVFEVLNWISGSGINFWYIGIGVLVLFGIGYALIYYLLERMVTRKIRLLFRTIHNFKINKGDFPVKMNEDVLAESEREVMKWAKQSREEIERLKEVEEFRREFVGNLSHELKTPIFSIQGYILTLLEGGLEDESINRKFLERASKGVDRMASLIEDLDSITKMELGRYKLEIDKVDLLELANEIADSFEIKAKKRKVEIGVDNRYKEDVTVLCDRDKIGQVLTNLVNNSLNYNKEGGKTEIRIFDLEDNILIEVADTGIGIGEEHLKRLFERFYRVDRSRSRDEGGTGLGLAICKHIIEAHGQSINVRSTVGQGSTFSFTLRKA